ncbi:MAG: hypothetical protein E7656_05650 [Ruminococcaceae bacterium]|nr:hypothetical protein [Oscillospiraceae bacterium]
MLTAILDKAELKRAHEQKEPYLTVGTDLVTIEKECIQLFEKYKGTSVAVARAYVIDHILSNARIFYHPDELFVFGIENCNITGKIRYEMLWQSMKDVCPESATLQLLGYESGAYTGDCDFGHNCPDYDRLFALGIGGIIAQAKKRAEKYPENSREHDLLRSIVISYTALQKLIDRYIALAGKHKEKDENCALVYTSLLNIRENPPKNIHEALQLQMLLYSVMTIVTENNARTLGIFDKLIYPFYKNDVESGRFSEKDVRIILSHLFFRYYTMKFTANTPLCLCGQKEVCDFSLMVLEEYDSLDINDPKIQIRCHKELADDILEYAVSCISRGRNSIVFLNDDVVIAALTKLGADKEDAKNYVPVGCYEPLCAGKEIAATCAGRIILPKAVEYAFTSGYDLNIKKQVGAKTKPIEEIATFDEFYAIVKEQISHLSDITLKVCYDFERFYPNVNSSPFFTPLLCGCITEDGVHDAYDSGAKYNNTSINAFGIATLAGELSVIKKAVFEEKRLSLCELFDILKNDWQGNEELRIEFFEKYPKYGNGNALPDGIAADIMRYCASLINGVPNCRGGVFRLGAFSIDWCFTFGKNLLATADGRHSGDPMSKNMCAITATDKGGVTSLVRSVTSVDYTDIPNGTVLDLMLHRSVFSGEDGIKGVSALVRAYMKMGGFAVQINSFDPKVLRAAQKMPQKYSTLQVRRCGWNVYFNELSKKEQDEFIKQAENL